MTSIESASDIGNAIALARKAQGLTQAELAKRAGVHQPKVSEIENGKATAHVGLVLRIVLALGLTINIGDGDTPIASVASRAGPDVVFDEPQPDDSIDLDALVDRRAR
jgi:y4mF family transcriptional regulator